MPFAESIPRILPRACSAASLFAVFACGTDRTGPPPAEEEPSQINTVEASASQATILVEEIVTVSCLRRSPAGTVLAGSNSQWDVSLGTGGSTALEPVVAVQRGPTRQFKGMHAGGATVFCSYLKTDGSVESIGSIQISVVDYLLSWLPTSRTDPLARGETEERSVSVVDPRGGAPLLLTANNMSFRPGSSFQVAVAVGATPSRAVVTALTSAPPVSTTVLAVFRTPSGREITGTLQVPLVHEGTVACQPSSIPVGGTSNCVLRTSAGQSIANDGFVTWTSDAPDRATVNAVNGLVTGVSPGPVTILARRRWTGNLDVDINIRGSAPLTVTAPTPPTAADLIGSYTKLGSRATTCSPSAFGENFTVTLDVIADASSPSGVRLVEVHPTVTLPWSFVTATPITAGLRLQTGTPTRTIGGREYVTYLEAEFVNGTYRGFETFTLVGTSCVERYAIEGARR
jgi:hypothetical protein